MRQLLTKAQEIPHLFVYCMIALNTLARPDAVLDLAPAQVNLKDRRISLNPQGRKQTKKFRPIVPITDTLLSFVQETDRPRFVTWHGKAVNRIDGSFGRMIANAQLPSEITPYSLRHTMATELRRRGVPPWEVEGLLGHRRPGVTEKYAHFAPDYLSEGRAAIDAYFAELSIGYTLPTLICVPSACQSQGMEKSAEADLPTSTGNWMVGVTGIEPVTPTMST
ncbi:site-specific integrase [Rhizobium laguerreae]|uniref:site-specific integrase n=1 Tax=Rhizobium laguerreae TaxID=1076926 RepID=UPI0035E42A74